MTNKESYFASLHILMRAILMAQRTLAAGFTDTGIEKAAAKSASAGKYKISVNQRNLRLINSCLYSLCLCSFVPSFLYNCREIFTNQTFFMQNEPNFRKSQMIVNKVLTKDYEKKTLGGVGKTNPKRTQTNPKRTQFQKGQNERNIYYNSGL